MRAVSLVPLCLAFSVLVGCSSSEPAEDQDPELEELRRSAEDEAGDGREGQAWSSDEEDHHGHDHHGHDHDHDHDHDHGHGHDHDGHDHDH